MRVRLGATNKYVAAVIKTLPKFRPAAFDLTLDDEPALAIEAMLVVVGTGISYGGGMKVLPSSRLDDGLLDVCIVGGMSKGAFLRAFPRVYMGKHTTHPKVRMLRGTNVKIGSDRQVMVYADGERIGSLPAIFEIVPRALKVVVGPDAPGVTR